MSVGLVFVRAHSPDCLERELVRGGRACDLMPLILRAQEHKFALPEREGRDDLTSDLAEVGRLDVIVPDARNESLIQLVSRADVTAEPSGTGARGFLLQSEQLAAQRPFVVEGARRGPPG